MDISAFLVSQQTDPQSRALAANALTPGMGGRGEEQQYDAAQGQQQQDPMAPDGAIPMPATTGGLDQAALDQGSTPQPPPDDHADEQQGFEDGGPVHDRPGEDTRFGNEYSENIEDRRAEGKVGWSTDAAVKYNIKNGLGQDVRKDDTVKTPMAAWGRTADKIGTKFFDEGGAIPDMPGAEPPEDNAAMESDPRIALKAALDYGYNHHAVNRPIPDEMQGPDIQAMMHGAGATSFDQAEHALKMFNGDSAKTISAVYDFYNKQGDAAPEEAPAAPKHWGSQATGEHGPMAFAKKAWDTISAQPEGASPVQAVAEEFGKGENTKEGSGAAAAWGVLQQIRKGVGSLFAGARAADDHGNAPKAAELLKGALDRLPDGTTANVVPNPDGSYGVTTSTGWKGNLGPDEFGNIVTMPFDKIVNMGVDHALQSVTPRAPLDSAVPGNEFANPSQRFPQIRGAPLDKDGRFDPSAPHDWRPEIQSHEQGRRTRGQVPGMPKGYKNPNADYSQVTKEDRRGWGTADPGRYGNAGVLTNDQANNLIYKLQKQGASDNQIKQEIARIGGARPSSGINVQSGGQETQRYEQAGGGGAMQKTYESRDATNPVLSHERTTAATNQMHKDVAQIGATSRANVADITAKGRAAAQGGANGMAKMNIPAELRLRMKQHIDAYGPPMGPDGKPSPQALEQLQQKIEAQLYQEINRQQSQFGGQRAPQPQQPPGQQGAAPPAAAPQPAQSGGNTPPRGTPGAKWTNPQGEQYEYTTNYQGQSGWKKVGRLPTG